MSELSRLSLQSFLMRLVQPFWLSYTKNNSHESAMWNTLIRVWEGLSARTIDVSWRSSSQKSYMIMIIIVVICWSSVSKTGRWSLRDKAQPAEPPLIIEQ